MPQKLVIWDFNGTLLNDTRYIYDNGVCPIFRKFGLEPPTFEEYLNEVTSDFMRFYYDHGVPRIETAQSLDAIMLESFSRLDPPPFFEEVPAVLTILSMQRHRQVLVTGWPADDCDRRLREYRDIRRFFEEIHGRVRDKRLPFREIMGRLGFAPADTVGITDTVGDAEALRDCGILPIVVSRGFHGLDRILDAHPAIPTMIIAPHLRVIPDLVR